MTGRKWGDGTEPAADAFERERAAGYARARRALLVPGSWAHREHLARQAGHSRAYRARKSALRSKEST